MMLKGDRVQLNDGSTGEVIELWGFARTFARIKLDSDGRLIPVMASYIVSYQRPMTKPKWGGVSREKRKKANA